MTTAVIVQARLGSSRLPGKVLKPLAGGTVLEEVLRRCRAKPRAKLVVCAAHEDRGHVSPLQRRATQVRCAVPIDPKEISRICVGRWIIPRNWAFLKAGFALMRAPTAIQRWQELAAQLKHPTTIAAINAEQHHSNCPKPRDSIRPPNVRTLS